MLYIVCLCALCRRGYLTERNCLLTLLQMFMFISHKKPNKRWGFISWGMNQVICLQRNNFVWPSSCVWTHDSHTASLAVSHTQTPVGCCWSFGLVINTCPLTPWEIEIGLSFHVVLVTARTTSEVRQFTFKKCFR